MRFDGFDCEASMVNMRLGPVVKGYLYREKNRTVMDVFNQSISGRLPVALETVAAQIVRHCRTQHTYQNRTGALERSIGYTKARRVPTGIEVEVYAGGPSFAKYTYDYAQRTQKGNRRRNVRYVYGNVVRVRRNTYLWVDYAAWVEKKGYPVLSQGIRAYKNKIARIVGQMIKITGNLPGGGRRVFVGRPFRQ